MYQISDLQLFLRALDLGSITSAGRSLGLSAAVASQRLQRLERELGVRLLHRTTRELQATPEGAALAEHGRTPLGDLEALINGLHHAAGEVTGTLRLTMPPSFGRQYISPLLPEFLTRYPHVRLDVDLSDQMLNLVNSGFDLAIRIGALSDSGLVARRIASNRRVLCASPAYLESYGEPSSPEELSGHECLVLAGSGERPDIWRFRAPDGSDVAITVTGRVQSNQGELLRDAALADLGIARHSLWHVCDDLAAGRLRVVLEEYAIPDSGIHAVMPQRRLVPPRVRAFTEFLRERLGVEPPWERVSVVPHQ